MPNRLILQSCSPIFLSTRFRDQILPSGWCRKIAEAILTIKHFPKYVNPPSLEICRPKLTLQVCLLWVIKTSLWWNRQVRNIKKLQATRSSRPKNNSLKSRQLRIRRSRSHSLAVNLMRGPKKSWYCCKSTWKTLISPLRLSRKSLRLRPLSIALEMSQISWTRKSAGQSENSCQARSTPTLRRTLVIKWSSSKPWNCYKPSRSKTKVLWLSSSWEIMSHYRWFRKCWCG